VADYRLPPSAGDNTCKPLERLTCPSDWDNFVPDIAPARPGQETSRHG